MKQDGINKIVENKNSSIDQISYTRYDKMGVSKPLADNETAAMTITIGKNTYYKVKAQSGGKMYDPELEKSRSGYSLTMQERHKASDTFAFKDVTEDAFNSYVKYLKTRYTSFLSVAERN